MNSLKSYLPWIVRILIFVLFIVSGVAKMFPIWAFEKQLVDLGITSWCYAPYLSRSIIAFEIAIGIAILQPHFLKRIVIPATLLLLVAFCVHLSIEMVKNGAMNGNCGCFGQLIPMTPLEAFIKNILTIGLLVYLYKNADEKPPGQNKFSYLLIIYLVSLAFMFMAFPFCPCEKENDSISEAETPSSIIYPDETADQSEEDHKQMAAEPESDKSETHKDTLLKQATARDTVIKPKINPGPKSVKSKYSEFTTFSNKTVELDKGKKIVCLFVPGCDHCREAGKELVKLMKNKNFPPVYVLFMDEEAEKIPDFYKEINHSFPYKVIEIPKFFKLLGSNANTPGISYLWNGNLMKYYEGSGDNKLNADELLKMVSTAQ
ncbi:MAG: DoxX family protein [Flavobacteriales bacterium]|nr:DoxX family protein [Flavobacteriales bacterium]